MKRIIVSAIMVFALSGCAMGSRTGYPNVYGQGAGMDSTGKPVTVQPAYPNQRGYYGDSVIQKPNAYGPGIGMDQYGRPVRYAPGY